VGYGKQTEHTSCG